MLGSLLGEASISIESPRESYLINDEAVHRYDGGFVFATTSCSLGHTCVCVSLHSLRSCVVDDDGERTHRDVIMMLSSRREKNSQ